MTLHPVGHVTGCLHGPVLLQWIPYGRADMCTVQTPPRFRWLVVDLGVACRV